MFAVVIHWTVTAKNSAVFAELLKTQARNSLAREEACRTFDICQNPDDPGHFVLYEVYDNEVAFEAHLASEHFAKFTPKAAPLTLSKEVHNMHRIAP